MAAQPETQRSDLELLKAFAERYELISITYMCNAVGYVQVTTTEYRRLKELISIKIGWKRTLEMFLGIEDDWCNKRDRRKKFLADWIKELECVSVDVKLKEASNDRENL